MSAPVTGISLRLGVSLLALALVSSCGGGGGSGGGGSGSGGVRFSLSPISVSANYFQNDPAPLMQTVATATGTLPEQFFIGAVDEGTAIDPEILVYLSDRQASFQITPRSGLAPGTYTGRLRLMACTTEDCGKQIGNSPLFLPYTITVRQDLTVSPAQDDFTAQSGSDISVPLTITLPEGATTFQTEFISQNNICSTADVSATSLRAVLRSLPSGNYFCTLRVTSEISSGTRVVQRIFQFTVTPPPGGDHNISATPAYFSQTTTEGARSDPDEVIVTPASWDSHYDYTVDYWNGLPGWLEVTPTANGYSVMSNAVSLPADTYNATLRIYGAPPAGGADISIAFTVGPGLVRPADRTLIVSSDTTAAQLGGTVPVDLNAGAPVPFSAQSDVPWLTLPLSSGQTGGSLTFSFDNAGFRALPNGQVHVAHITVSSSHLNISPVAFQVSVDKRLGEVTGLGPYLHTAGKPLRFYVRGTGLSLAGNIANRLQLDGITGANITTVNDTTLLVTASAQAAGDHVLSMSNALGLAMPHSTLKIIDPVTSQYRAIPTGDIPAAVFYDAERQTLFWAGTATSPTLHALRRAGANWTDTPSGITYAEAFGITHDGSAVLVGGGGSMNFLDPQTLALQQTVSMGYSHDIITTQNAQVPVTNDGLIWYRAPDIINDSFVGHYDPLTEERGTIRAPSGFYPGLLPWFHVTRDGEKFTLWHQHGGGILRSSDLAAGFSQPTDTKISSASDDGSRFLQGQQLCSPTEFIGYVNDSIYDADNSRTVLQAVVSPDGQRVYALSYDRLDYFNENDPLPPPYSNPRIYVLDATPSVQQPLAHLPILGNFAINDFPTCRNAGQCGLYTVATISPDGRTLFFAGNQSLVVVPIPDESTLQHKARRINYVTGPGGARMYEWRPR